MSAGVLSFFQRLGLWTAVCSISAVPSFLCASTRYDDTAMVCGVGIFACLYTMVTGSAVIERLKQKRFVQRTLYIGYGTRLALSLAYPVGLYADLYPGFISTDITRALFAEPTLFAGTLVTTLIQGILLNVVLGIFMAIVFGVQRIFLYRPIPEGFCQRCAYDLTGNVSGICPECGVDIRATTRSRNITLRML